MTTPASPKSELTTTQQTMLDLALACDLKISEASQHDAIRNRHKAIVRQRDAADYIREVENRVHSRRKFKPQAKTLTTVATAAAKLTVPRKLTSKATSLWILALLVVMGLAGWFAFPGLNLVLVTASLLAMLAVLGRATTGQYMGVLINDQNLMSLSRFQMGVWTVLVLSSYLTFALVRIRWMAQGLTGQAPIDDPLNIQMDWHLWGLLGLSTTSLVASPLILSTKKENVPAPSVTQKTAQLTGEAVETVNANRQGTLYANQKMADASFTDMFEGDELVNTARLDLAKVQMFYFTVIAAICFYVMVFKMLLANSSNLDHLPLLPDGFVAVLGISHAGYLGSKGIPRTQSHT